MTADSPGASAALERVEEICAASPEVTERLSHHTPTLWCPAAPGMQAEPLDWDWTSSPGRFTRRRRPP